MRRPRQRQVTQEVSWIWMVLGKDPKGMRKSKQQEAETHTS